VVTDQKYVSIQKEEFDATLVHIKIIMKETSHTRLSSLVLIELLVPDEMVFM
jgi:hypothetical protein